MTYPFLISQLKYVDGSVIEPNKTGNLFIQAKLLQNICDFIVIKYRKSKSIVTPGAITRPWSTDGTFPGLVNWIMFGLLVMYNELEPLTR